MDGQPITRTCLPVHGTLIKHYIIVTQWHFERITRTRIRQRFKY